MSRVLIAIVAACAALAMSGCTGSIRIGSSVPADYVQPFFGS
jgi:hypothetical protein